MLHGVRQGVQDIMKAFNDEKSLFYHKNRLNETAFILENNQYGRIIYNNRYVDPDNSHWYYGWHVYNIINCDISECKEKMFLKRVQIMSINSFWILDKLK